MNITAQDFDESHFAPDYLQQRDVTRAIAAEVRATATLRKANPVTLTLTPTL